MTIPANSRPDTKRAELAADRARPDRSPRIVRFARSETLQAVALLFVILNVGFYPSLWGDRTLMMSSSEASSVIPQGAYGAAHPPTPFRSMDPGAPAWQFEPAMAFNHQQFWEQHHLPIWNPYVGYGAPWAAGMLSQPFFPLSFLLALDPTPRTVSWFLILRLLTAGFFSYLFLRYFVRHAPALAGAIACMLTGYFIIFLNIDHLSTDVLLPLVFYAMERLVRQGNARAALLAAIVVFLAVVSGMPESTLLTLLYGYAYFLFRLLTASEFRQRFWLLLRNFVLANILGFALTAFLLLPFMEFLRHGLDSHRPSVTGIIGGLIHVTHGPRELLLYFLPLANGPLFMNIFGASAGYVELLGYFGVTVTALGLSALLAAARNWRRVWRDETSLLTVFFFLSVASFLLKYFGNPAVNWVGYLPGLNLILFPKYIQPLMGFAVAILCGFGASYVFSGRARLGDIFAAAFLVVGLIVALATGYRVELLRGDKLVFYFYLNVICGIIGLMILTAAMALSLHKGKTTWEQRRRQLGRAAVLTLITIELLGNFIYPEFYYIDPVPAARLNPYVGAPYIRFLKQRSDSYYRVFAREQYLYPNWSSAFGLYDVRYIYGVNWNDFFKFIRAFLAPGPLEAPADLADRFTGDGYSYQFGSWKQRRFLQISSIRYLIGGGTYLSDLSALITDLLAQNQSRIKAENLHVDRAVFRIDGKARDVLFEHPPSSRVAASILVPADAPVLTFSPALDPAVYGGACPAGDGVDFTLELQEPDGKISPLYRRYLDAKQNASDRHWLDTRIDLSRYVGQKVTLLFSTDGGPRGDTACDWAGWAGLRFVGTAPTTEQAAIFRQVYDGEAHVYEYSGSLPRASVFYSVAPVSSPPEALARIQDPSLDVWRQVVISTDSVDAGTRRNLESLSHAAPDMAQTASIMFYDSQRVRIRASLNGSGIVMLTDSNYPGWNAYLDGRRVPLLTANYLFRGVLAPAGSHEIEFRYEPKSYLYGGMISLMAVLTGLAWFGTTTQRGKFLIAQLRVGKLE